MTIFEKSGLLNMTQKDPLKEKIDLKLKELDSIDSIEFLVYVMTGRDPRYANAAHALAQEISNTYGTQLRDVSLREWNELLEASLTVHCSYNESVDLATSFKASQILTEFLYPKKKAIEQIMVDPRGDIKGLNFSKLTEDELYTLKTLLEKAKNV